MEYQDLVRDFAKRTRDNLEAIRSLDRLGANVYEVTQLINSMLGLLVLPKERYYESIPTSSLEELRADGWPSSVLTSEFKDPKHLRDLARLLRNSIAHFHIEFIDANGIIDGVVLSNKCNCGDITWRVSLSLSDLEETTMKFIELILEDTTTS